MESLYRPESTSFHRLADVYMVEEGKAYLTYTIEKYIVSVKSEEPKRRGQGVAKWFRRRYGGLTALKERVLTSVSRF